MLSIVLSMGMGEVVLLRVFMCEIISLSTNIKNQKTYLVDHIVFIIIHAPDNYEKVKSPHVNPI